MSGSGLCCRFTCQEIRPDLLERGGGGVEAGTVTSDERLGVGRAGGSQGPFHDGGEAAEPGCHRTRVPQAGDVVQGANRYRVLPGLFGPVGNPESDRPGLRYLAVGGSHPGAAEREVGLWFPDGLV